MPKRQLQGTIVSDKGNKTITVLVERKFLHPVYKKTMKSSKKYAAHDENNNGRVGDKVIIEESRPISKTKKWVLISGSTGDARQQAAPIAKPQGKAKAGTKKPVKKTAKK